MMLAALSLVMVMPTQWIVDANNGPGTNFVDLPACVATASDGDTILIRPGSYTGTTIDKSLTLRRSGSGIATVASIVVQGPALSSGPSVTATLAGLRIAGTSTAVLAQGLACYGDADLVVSDCQVLGTVFAWLGDLTLLRSTFEPPTSSTMTGLSGATIQGDAASRSRLVAHGCTFRGGLPTLNCSGPPGTLCSAYCGDAIRAGTFADVQLSDCICEGGSLTTPNPQITIYGGTAIYADAANVRIAGDQTMIVQAGEGNSPTLLPPSIYIKPNSGGAVVGHGPISVLPAAPGGPLTSPGVVLGQPEFTRLAFSGTALPSGELDASQPVQVAFDGLLPFSPYFFAIGTDDDLSFAFDPLLLGGLTVDVSTASIFLDNLDNNGQLNFSFVPATSLPSVLGLPVFAQAGAFDFAIGQFRVSNLEARLFSL